LTDSSFGIPNVNCGIPIPITITTGDTIQLCGIAYTDDTQPTKIAFGVHLFYFDCTGRNFSQINELITNDAFDQFGLFCFNLEVNPPITFSGCNHFIAAGFSTEASDGTNIKLTFTIKTS
jgi:hypothetical protein